MGGFGKHNTDAGRAKSAVLTETSSTAVEPNVELVCEQVSLTCTSGGDGTVSVLSDARVGTGRKFYLTGIHTYVDVAAHGASKTITLYDNSDHAIASAAGTTSLASTTCVSLGGASLSASTTTYAGYATTSLAYSGATSGKGLYLKSTGTTTTCVLSAAVTGFIK
jgi:hypothetical protein